MKIGILGGGRVGGALAQSWQAAGHDVVVSTRDTVGETAAPAQVVLLAVPATVAAGILAAAGSLDRKVLEAFARLVIGIAYRQGQGPFVYRFAPQ